MMDFVSTLGETPAHDCSRLTAPADSILWTTHSSLLDIFRWVWNLIEDFRAGGF